MVMPIGFLTAPGIIAGEMGRETRLCSRGMWRLWFGPQLFAAEDPVLIG